MFLVSLAHQFIWLSFGLVFTRNVSFKYSQIWMYLKLASFVNAKTKLGLNEVDCDYIFTMSDRAAFRGTYRTESDQTSKIKLCIRKIGS